MQTNTIQPDFKNCDNLEGRTEPMAMLVISFYG